VSKATELGLPIADWSEVLRETWQNNVARQGWSTRYAAAIRRGVERWFMFAGAGVLPTPGLVAAYEQALRETVSERSALTYLQHLSYGVQLLAPGESWGWLMRYVLDRLPRAVPPSRAPAASRKRLGLPVAEWPTQWRASWVQITRRASPFRFLEGQDNPIADWSPAYRKRVERGVGLLAGFIATHDRPPSLAVDLVHDFLDDCAHRSVSGQSMGMFAEEIHRAFTLIDPERDLSWLRKLADELKSARPVRNKSARLLRSQEIQEGGQSLMRRARRRPLTTETALQFRDGLIVAVWAVRPYRLSDFASLTLNDTLLVGKGWATIIADRTKNGDGHVTPWPKALFAGLEEYLRVYRAYLIDTAPDHGRVWIGRDGGPLTTGGLSRHVGDVTERLFGRRINPHLMRDCCVTSILEADPRESLRASALEHFPIILDHNLQQRSS